MKRVLFILASFACAFILQGCQSTKSSTGDGYYAPEPERAIDRTTELQQGIGQITRSGIR